jgi:AraC family transcriptional regulator, regulatory protein of adaptative response / methylphosphotriester-DNA alkyltransferase methyltransferase
VKKPRPSTLKEYERAYEDVLEFVNGEYQADIQLDDFCRRRKYSRRSVQRALAHYKTNWRRVLMHRRMAAASHMLLNTNHPVNHIANAVGYSQPAQFAKAFRSVHGLAPMAYRQAFKVRREMVLS